MQRNADTLLSTREISQEEMAVYRATAQDRQARKEQEQRERCERARILARKAATLLKEKPGVERVVLFGSLARGDLFHARSDIDLCVWGLDEKVYYTVVSQLLDLDPTIEIDLVMAENAPTHLLETIEAEGITL